MSNYHFGRQVDDDKNASFYDLRCVEKVKFIHDCAINLTYPTHFKQVMTYHKVRQSEHV
jgi:hypothetical protein